MMDKRLLALVPEAMRHVILTVLWQWLGLLGTVGLSYAVAMLAAVLVGGGDISGVLVPFGCLVAFALVARAVSTRMSQRESFAASEDVKRTLRRKVYQKLLALGPGYTEQVSTAEVVQLSVEGTEQLETYFGQYLPQLFYAVLAPVTLFVVVAPMSLASAAVLLVFVPLIPVVIVVVQKIAKRILAGYWDQYAELGDSFLENLQGLTTLKIYDADAARHEAMNKESEHFRQVTMKVLSMQLNSIIVMDVVALGGAVAGIAVALAQLAAGMIDLLVAVFVILVSSEFFIPMRQLGSYFHVAMNGMAASEKIFRLLELPEPPKRPAVPGRGDMPSLSHVTFGYEEGRTVLSDVSLEVPARGVTAIVGASGSGKSTVASLLMGRHLDYEGDVLMGKSQVADLDPQGLMAHVTGIGIGARIFRGTVRDNLLMATPDATDEELWGALERARLAGFLRTQEGLETALEESGSNLSGGQRQRLALARALLHDTPVYVFDEATSNIDVESEAGVMGAIRELARDHAVVLISHRLANVTDARRIYVLEDGCVTGEGTHEELLADCGTYQRLWNGQQELERYAEFGKGAADA